MNSTWCCWSYSMLRELAVEQVVVDGQATEGMILRHEFVVRCNPCFRVVVLVVKNVSDDIWDAPPNPSRSKPSPRRVATFHERLVLSLKRL